MDKREESGVSVRKPVGRKGKVRSESP